MVNRLTLIRFFRRNGVLVGLYRCSCGKTKEITKSNAGRCIFSCGCLRREYMRKLGLGRRVHGCARHGKQTPEYVAWSGMKNRCYNSRKSDYKHYGGRGISVCRRWLNSFESFLSDMGRRPSEAYSIDRINNDGNYEPSNCRWATLKQQANNKRPKKRICK